jgi:hypothetical protein
MPRTKSKEKKRFDFRTKLPTVGPDPFTRSNKRTKGEKRYKKFKKLMKKMLNKQR